MASPRGSRRGTARGSRRRGRGRRRRAAAEAEAEAEARGCRHRCGSGLAWRAEGRPPRGGAPRRRRRPASRTPPRTSCPSSPLPRSCPLPPPLIRLAAPRRAEVEALGFGFGFGGREARIGKGREGKRRGLGRKWGRRERKKLGLGNFSRRIRNFVY